MADAAADTDAEMHNVDPQSSPSEAKRSRGSTSREVAQPVGVRLPRALFAPQEIGDAYPDGEITLDRWKVFMSHRNGGHEDAWVRIPIPNDVGASSKHELLCASCLGEPHRRGGHFRRDR
jgi:hypothetical protein